MKSRRFKNISSNVSSRVFALMFCMSLITISSHAQKIQNGLNVKPSRIDSKHLLSPMPILMSNNPNCGNLNLSNDPSFAHITSDYELRLESPLAPFSGTFQFINNPPNQFLTGAANSSNTLTTNNQDNFLSFSSTIGISAVIVKEDSNANVYVYPQASFGDTGLTTPDYGQFGISQVTFCYYMPATVTIIKEVQTFDSTNASTQVFPFTATNFSTSNFLLVDNNAQPADRVSNNAIYSFGAANAVTVTESPVPTWTVGDLDCVETAGGGLPNLRNTTTSLAARRANIVLEQGENVVCTFSNLQVSVSSANASISGRILTETGLPLRRAAISVFNANTLETQIVYTNPLGFYRIENLPVNNFYIVTVSHGKRAFNNNTQAFTLNDNLSEVNFFALY